MAIEVAAAEAANGVIGAADGYRLCSARHGPPDPRRGVPRRAARLRRRRGTDAGCAFQGDFSPVSGPVAMLAN